MSLFNLIKQQFEKARMSKSLDFLTNGHKVTFTCRKKKFPAQCYSQTFINISVAQLGQEGVLYEVDLDDNYLLANFLNLSKFFTYLSRNKNREIVRYIRCDEISVLAYVDDEMQEEIIQLNKIHALPQKQYQAIVNRQNFYTDVFKTKIIQKIEKTVKNYFKKKTEPKEEKVEEKEQLKKEAEPSAIFVSFKVQGKDQEYHLTKQSSVVDFDLPTQIMGENQFTFTITSFKCEKVFVYADYFNPIKKTYLDTKRCVQFGKSFSSSFRIDEGHTLSITRQEGELVIKNMSSNNGKIFYQSTNNKVDVVFKISISLKQIL